MVTNQIKKNTGGGGATIPEGVDQAELGYLDGVLSSIQDQLNARELVANKNQAGGYAGLDGSARLPAAQLPTTVPVRASGGAQYSLPGYNASGDFVDSGLSFASGTLNGALTYIQRSDENRIILNGIGGNLVKGGTNVASWSASGLFVGAGGGLAAAALECRSTSQQARFSYSDLVYWDWITTASNNAQLSRGGVNEWVFTRSGTNPNSDHFSDRDQR